MARELLVVESPAKIRTIRDIVGRKFEIRASVGHIRDIPPDSMGVDIEKDFRMTFVTIKGKAKVIQELKAAAQKADRVYIATDPDREGEAIAWHVSQLVPAAKPVERITFNAITRSEIEHALKNPTQINQSLVESQFARRIIDRLIGYLLSPEASRHLGDKYSVGRVQSPALALIVEREREIRAFVPTPYWILGAVYRKDNIEFTALLSAGQVKDENEAGRIAEAILNAPAHGVASVESREVAKNPPPPFITSTFQRAAFKALRMSSKRAMRIAQDLYEGIDVGGKHVALITYMRTDSPRISNEGIEAAREQVVAQFGQDYYQRRNFRGKAGAQDAHEAIRPAHPEITPEMVKNQLEKAHLQVYSLIYKRWLASQMKPALFNQVTVNIKAGEVALKAVGSTLTFEGFLKIYGRDLNEQEQDEDGEDRRLPKLAEGDALEFVSVKNDKKMTQPPPRYNNGSLVEKLESLGIGRPSTYAAIVELIQERGYVEESSKNRQFVPTVKGEKLYDYLKEFRGIVVDYEFTANMEGELDGVEEGKKPYLDVVKEEFERVKDAYEIYKKSGGFGMAHKPTAKQLALSGRLAKAAGIEIPQDALTDSKKLSDWIDHVKDTVHLGKLPPSDKQLAYAAALARDTGLELSDEMRNDSEKISQFINQARKILDKKVAANKRPFAINYMEEGIEREFETTDVIDVIDTPEKKAVGLRLNVRQTKWIPRSQIVRLADSVLTLKSKWAAETVYKGARYKRGAGQAGGEGAARGKGARRFTRKGARKSPPAAQEE
ncbi:type I DNA topoisomerase [bacterium]|nr:type I DNA topoisomerase [bacterium]